MMRLDWKFNVKFKTWEVRLPIRLKSGESGEYHIWLAERPRHCDRGRWVAQVDASPAFACLDDQEGFPRYYFDLDRALAELEAWINARREILTAAVESEAR